MSNEAETMKKSKRTLTPKLRFPEFRDEPGWEPTPLSALLDYEQPGKYIVEGSNYQDTGTPVLTANKSFVLGHTAETTGVFEDIPVIIFDDFTTDKKYVDFPFKVKSSAIKILRSRGNDELKLIYELMSRIRFDPAQHKRYYISQYQNLEISLPSPPEQQKIAECLSSLDGLIAAEGRTLEALKAHKKGLMQQLFPREGETMPRLRFPEFQDAEKWKYAPLGKLLVSSPDYGVNAAAVPYSELLPQYLRITDISDDGTYLSEAKVSVDLESTDGKYLDEGDIVLARTGASVGKSYKYRKEDGRLVFAGFLIRIKPDKKKLVTAYLANFLMSGQYWKWVAITSARSGQPGINSTEYSSLSIPLPPDLAEQQRIAACLTALDTRLAAQAAKIDALKQHKRGLMQQLFPAPEVS